MVVRQAVLLAHGHVHARIFDQNGITRTPAQFSVGTTGSRQDRTRLEAHAQTSQRFRS